MPEETSESAALKQFGAQVRTRRLAVDMTQVELSEAVGLTRTSIANIEAGRQNLGYNAMLAVANGLGVTVVELLTTEVVAGVPARFDATVLFGRLDMQREEAGLSWKQVAAQTQVSASTFTRMGVHGLTLSLDTLARLLLWLGDTDIEAYIRTDDRPAPAQPTTSEE